MARKRLVHNRPLIFLAKEMIDIDRPRYTKEEINAVYDGDVYTITNLTPDIHMNDRQERKDEIEKALYDVFSKYTPNSKSIPAV